ncbi:18934_t:CDS:2 [Rhizophagus irregularis]|nr:18934_t:CDS:2 [Rhizophagus irregularis]
MQSILFAEYTKILETGELSDIEITVGKEPNTKTYRLHSFILKVCSPYFRELLSKKQPIKIENGIKIANKNISAKAFEILIKYIYSDKLKLENNGFKINVELLVAANELHLNELCSFIETHLLMNEGLLKQNFVLIQTVADRHKFTKLSKYYKNAYQQDPSLFLKANDFTDISEGFLLRILTKDNLSLKPIEVWNKIIEWAIARSNELPSEITKWTTDNVKTCGTLIKQFIPYIKFEEIPAYDKVNPSTFGEVDDSSLLSTCTVEPLRANFVDFSTIRSLLKDVNSGPEFGSDLKLLLNNTNRGQYCKNNYSEKIRQIEAEFEIEEYEVFQITKNSN